MITWTNNLPNNTTLSQILYDCRRADGDNDLIMDSVSMADILEQADEILLFDALVSTYARLERKMSALKAVMERAGGDVKPVTMQISDPFKQNGVAQVAVVYELSDGQTITFFFHNPDIDPRKIAPPDELISWKLLLNKRDITIIAAPERGKDINVHEVAQRIMKLAAKNSPAFQRANARRAERMKQIEDLKAEIAGLEKELASAQSELEAAKLEYEERSMNPPNPEIEYLYRRQNEMQNRFIAIKKALMGLGWLQGADGVSMVNTLSNHAVIYQAKENNLLKEIWKLYQFDAKRELKPVKEFVDKHMKDYAETPQEFAYRIDKSAV
ncbi:MAG: defense against restriction DarA-related protein [Methylosarcina sp.]